MEQGNYDIISPQLHVLFYSRQYPIKAILGPRRGMSLGPPSHYW
jgi:hypothetical protein